MKVNNYIKILSAVLIIFGYSNDGYSVENKYPKLRRVNAIDYSKFEMENNDNDNNLKTLDQKIKHPFVQRKNALTQNDIEKLEKDLPRMGAESNLAQSLTDLYEKITDDTNMMLKSKELQKNLQKLGKSTEIEANAKLKGVESKISELCNVILDSISDENKTTNDYIKQLQDYMYDLTEYFNNLKNRYIEQDNNAIGIGDVMDITGQNPNLSHCAERINNWCYYFNNVKDNYQNLLNIK